LRYGILSQYRKIPLLAYLAYYCSGGINRVVASFDFWVGSISVLYLGSYRAEIAPMNLLITTIEELQAVVTVNGDLSLTSLYPHLRAAQLLLHRLTDRDTVQDIADKLSENVDLSEEEGELLVLMQTVVANLGLMKYSQVTNVMVTDLGVHRTETKNMKDAFEWQLDRLTRQLRNDAFDALENLLDHLDRNRNIFTHWAVSTQYQQNAKRLIRSAAQFNSFHFIDSSRLIYHALASAQERAEEQLYQVAGVSGPLTALLALTSPNVEQLRQLNLARQVVVHWTMMRAIWERSLEVNTDGVQVRAISQFATTNYAEPAEPKQIASLVKYHEDEAQRILTLFVRAVVPSTVSGAGGVRGQAIVSF
jgi:hypothetical protein